MPLYLYTSNRLERLAAAFAELTSVAPLPPMMAETVILQSGGMARWLGMCVAERLGISANIDFPFPKGFADELFDRVLPVSMLKEKLDKQTLQWHLLRILPELLKRPEFIVLEKYLSGNRDLKSYQLARRLADLYDQYMIFRPEMILDWEDGRGDSWQALLWRELIGRKDCLSDVTNQARLQKHCLDVLERADSADLDLPSRLAVFGLSAIPPYYLKIFTALARHTDAHIFFLNPCREYWGDIVSEKTMALIQKGHPDGEGLYLSQGNPLLASTGQQGRELLSMLLEFDFAGEFELFEESSEGEESMLSTVQADILDLRDGVSQPAFSPADDDRSVMVHSCHGPMRELEVLHDQLLALFENSPDLGPHEIIVMTPDIESYGPLIEAVFGSRKPDGERCLPFSIADRNFKREGKLFNAFMHILELVGSRMEISRVMAVIEKEPVRRRFSLSLKELELVEKWLAAVNVRWGIDGEDRRLQGLPATVENTWRFGLDRLLLGYAMIGHDKRDFAGVLPFDEIEGGQVEALGRFLDFSEKIFVNVRLLEGKKNLCDWVDILLAIFHESLEATDEQQDEYRFIIDALGGLRKIWSSGDFTGEVEFDVVMAELAEIGRKDSLSSGFMAGGITFCEMLPMRSVPFKVVCLLGMNDNDFPRPSIKPAFDLIGAEPRPGDRSRRKDDRYLFLESILSARQCLYLSYIGRSVRDGGDMSPSILVSELIEYMTVRFGVKKERVLSVHPLQPFNPAYFSGSELFSYSAADCEAARMLMQPKMNSLLVPEPLPSSPAESREVPLADLERFFSNTPRFFCRKRLGIYLEDGAAELTGTENFSLDYLDRYRIGQNILDHRLSGEEEKDYFKVARQQGIMPHGTVARVSFSELAAKVNAMAGRLGMDLKSDVELLCGERTIDSHILTGRVETSPASGQVIYRFAALKARDRIVGWLRHLFLNCLAPPDWCRTTRVVGNDNKSVTFMPLADAEDVLAGVIDLYRKGIDEPLRFFPETSFEFAAAKRKGLPDSAALGRADRKWGGNLFGKAESDDRYCQLCYGNFTPLDQDFATASLAFFKPLLDGADQR